MSTIVTIRNEATLHLQQKNKICRFSKLKLIKDICIENENLLYVFSAINRENTHLAYLKKQEILITKNINCSSTSYKYFFSDINFFALILIFKLTGKFV